MKIAVISDIHQSEFWKKAVEQKDDFEKIIFLGDEFDTWSNDWPLQISNAEDIIAFKKANPGKVDLCWSNHATSYYLDERCSGYQSNHSAEIKAFYNRYKEFYNVVYIYNKWIFSHSGVSKVWIKNSGIKTVNDINQLFISSPNFFRWTGPDVSGNNANEGPLWIRPEALIGSYVQGFHQVAGHTENIQPRIVKKSGQMFVFCDTYDHNYLTIINTKNNSVQFTDMLN